MPKKIVVSRKDALITVANKEKDDKDDHSSDFSSDDIQSDYEDQMEESRALKRRKRDEFNKAEDKKIIQSSYLPTSTKKLSACIHCHLVLNREKWRKLEHCPNCPHSGGLAETTEQFGNLMGSVLPKVSWVAQWKGMRHLIPGFYAMSVAP